MYGEYILREDSERLDVYGEYILRWRSERLEFEFTFIFINVLPYIGV